MAQNLALEVKVINRFATKSKRDRYLQFVTSAKNRKKLIADLHGGSFYEHSMLERVTGIEGDVIGQALQRLGIASHTCYVISENTSIDTLTFDLNEVLPKVVVWGAGTMLVFGEADFVFVELAGLKNRFTAQAPMGR
ncbi:hypothetical protein [Hymenobacter perfusus]|uniref:Uncharacterized protein n=1 Tax=Hymenobacter perfusus TaxID=1236770 RepID=A0A3R9NP41_9BACT|nr:hypothetical protein [Hymenobacter perfusus]RSK38435.1 hypothetical protein EI293_21695 [Hymenobacter perfusus]